MIWQSKQRCEHLKSKLKVVLRSPRNILLHVKGKQYVIFGTHQDCDWLRLRPLLSNMTVRTAGGLWPHAMLALSEEILTVLATTSIFFILSSMKDHFAGILRAEGHSCFLSPLIYMRRESHSWRKLRKWSIAFAILCLWSAPLDYRFWGFLWIEEILDFYGRS